MKKANKILVRKRARKNFYRMLLVAAYILVFVLISYTSLFYSSAVRLNDLVLQRGISDSSDIIVIGITEDDLEYYSSDIGTLSAKIIEKLNSDSKYYPSAISCDISLNEINSDAISILESIDKKSNVILPVDLVCDNSYTFSSFGVNTEKLVIEDIITPTISKTGFKYGHTEKILDENGVLRQTLFDAKVEDGSTISSMAYLSYKLYCEDNDIKFIQPDLTDDNTAIIKFAKAGIDKDYCARDILSGSYKKDQLKGKIIYVGAYDDRYDTGYFTSSNYNEKMYSCVIDANITNALIERGFTINLPILYQVLLLVFGIALIVILVSKCTRFAGVCTCVIYAVLSIFVATLFYGIGYTIDIIPHFANSILTGVGVSIIVEGLRNRNKRMAIERVLGTYVDSNIAKDIISGKVTDRSIIVDNPSVVRNKNIAVLFADIRNFTTISEKLPAEQLVAILNRYLSMMADCVNRNGGTLDKFIGDCAMGYWGAPFNDSDAAYHACIAANEMQRRAKDLAQEIKIIYGVDTSIGIGVNFGEAIVGDIGSADRMNFTAVGDTVNTASRLEESAPGGEIYISESVKTQLESRGTAEKLQEKLKLKGKELPIDAYSLKSVTYKENKKVTSQKDIIVYKRKAIASIVLVLFTFISQFAYVANSIKDFGINFVAYYPVMLSLLSMITVGVMLPYSIQAKNNGDGIYNRNKFVDVLMLSGTVANIQIFATYFIQFFKISGLSHEIVSPYLGSSFVYIVCPIFVLLSFFIFENRTTYKWHDLILSEIILTATYVLSYLISVRVSINEIEPKLFNFFYTTPNSYILVAGEVILTIIVLLIYRLTKPKNIDDLRTTNAINEYSPSKLSRKLNEGNLKNYIAILFNVIILFFSIKVIVISSMSNDYSVYSNPSLTSILISIASLVSIFYYYSVIKRGSDNVKFGLYKYISYNRTLGCLINFFTVFFLATSGEGFKVFFENRWFGDFGLYVICPLLSFIIFLSEANRYRAIFCVLLSCPYMIILLISKNAIYKAHLEDVLSYELENFYTGPRLFIVVLSILCMVFVVYALSFATNRIKKENVPKKNSSIIICGSRSGVSCDDNSVCDYGTHSRCYVYRENDYALILNAGSGLINAKKLVDGCKNIDIVLISKSFSSLMGFLSVGNICEGANVRIISPFNFRGFSVKPFWPVDIIKGDWLKVSNGSEVEFKENLKAEFTEIEGKDNFMVRFKGAIDFAYIGEANGTSEHMREKLSGVGTLIYDGFNNYANGCYLAMDCQIPNLLISGYPTDIKEEEFERITDELLDIMESIYFVKEGESYDITGEEVIED